MTGWSGFKIAATQAWIAVNMWEVYLRAVAVAILFVLPSWHEMGNIVPFFIDTFLKKSVITQGLEYANCILCQRVKLPKKRKVQGMTLNSIWGFNPGILPMWSTPTLLLHSDQQWPRLVVLVIWFALVWFGLVWFYGISTTVGHFMPNPLYIYIYIYIYDF